MKLLEFAITLSLWPMRCSAGHEFDGETHKWFAVFGPIGGIVWFEPR